VALAVTPDGCWHAPSCRLTGPTCCVALAVTPDGCWH